MRTFAHRSALCAMAIALFVHSAGAQSLSADAVFSSIGVSMISPPNPVLGADNRIHLAYEVIASNTSGLFITLDKVEAVDKQGHVLQALAGETLLAMMRVPGAKDATMAPGGSAIIFMDTSFPAGSALPKLDCPAVDDYAANCRPKRQAGAISADRTITGDDRLRRTFHTDWLKTGRGDRPAAARIPLVVGQWVLRCADIASRRGDGDQRRAACSGAVRD